MPIFYFWIALVLSSILSALLGGNAGGLTAAAMAGAGQAITLGISIAGTMALWCGAAALMEQLGITGMLARLLSPLLHVLFPSTRTDSALAGDLSANICANLLGLGNAATPMGIRAAKRLNRDGTAGDELCRLIVLNTASIQLIPSTVAAIRGSLGSSAPFSILPAVWVTSFCSAGLGLAAAWLFGKLWNQ